MISKVSHKHPICFSGYMLFSLLAYIALYSQSKPQCRCSSFLPVKSYQSFGLHYSKINKCIFLGSQFEICWIQSVAMSSWCLADTNHLPAEFLNIAILPNTIHKCSLSLITLKKKCQVYCCYLFIKHNQLY